MEVDRSKFFFTVEIETPWQIDNDAAAMYLRQAIEDSVLAVGADIKIQVVELSFSK